MPSRTTTPLLRLLTAVIRDMAFTWTRVLSCCSSAINLSCFLLATDNHDILCFRFCSLNKISSLFKTANRSEVTALTLPACLCQLSSLTCLPGVKSTSFSLSVCAQTENLRRLSRFATPTTQLGSGVNLEECVRSSGLRSSPGPDPSYLMASPPSLQH